MSGFKVAIQRAYPSWGHWFENGADTMWEYWRVPRNRSHNHYVKGTVVQWLYENVAGPRPGSDGYRTFTVQPDARVGVSWARTSPRTVRGEVSVAWAAAEGVFRLRVKVRVGSTAEVHVPAPDRAEVTASRGSREDTAGHDAVLGRSMPLGGSGARLGLRSSAVGCRLSCGPGTA
ncbi:alpha-L-rhamnosidase C-terminal domain-containing protein [Streptomyces sp. NPDC087525]|uniref:alpha-L-rhamnosidase C-terminal domain-containing protein n=1 Tax=Streptomyces sp. NPDC087525 TaxID=3365793 RepID=UPI00382BA36A